MGHRFGFDDSGTVRSTAQSDGLIRWLRKRVLAAALSAAATITFLSLISPAWLDFMFDLIMVALIAVVGKLAKE